MFGYGQQPPILKFGTCSWKYDSWRGIVYSDAPKLNYLAEYASHLLLLKPRKWEVGRRNVAQPAAEPAWTSSEWITEESAVATLLTRWSTAPRTRALRDYFRALGALRRGGVKGKAMYRRTDVEFLGTAYVPVADHVAAQELGSRTVRQIIADVRNIAIGNVTLVAVADLPGLSKALTAYRGGIRSGAKIGKTGLPNSAKQGISCAFEGASGNRNIA